MWLALGERTSRTQRSSVIMFINFIVFKHLFWCIHLGGLISSFMPFRICCCRPFLNEPLGTLLHLVAERPFFQVPDYVVLQERLQSWVNSLWLKALNKVCSTSIRFQKSSQHAWETFLGFLIFGRLISVAFVVQVVFSGFSGSLLAREDHQTCPTLRVAFFRTKTYKTSRRIRMARRLSTFFAFSSVEKLKD